MKNSFFSDTLPVSACLCLVSSDISDMILLMCAKTIVKNKETNTCKNYLLNILDRQSQAIKIDSESDKNIDI